MQLPQIPTKPRLPSLSSNTTETSREPIKPMTDSRRSFNPALRGQPLVTKHNLTSSSQTQVTLFSGRNDCSILITSFIFSTHLPTSQIINLQTQPQSSSKSSQQDVANRNHESGRLPRCLSLTQLHTLFEQRDFVFGNLELTNNRTIQSLHRRPTTPQIGASRWLSRESNHSRYLRKWLAHVSRQLILSSILLFPFPLVPPQFLSS